MTQPDKQLSWSTWTVPVASIMNKEAVEEAKAEGKVYGTEVVDGTGPVQIQGICC